jgi:ribonuclease HI
MMALLDRKRSKSPKTQTIRKLMDQKPSKITLLWILRHVGIPGNDTADEVVKKALDEEIQHNEKFPPQDLIKWMKNKQQEEQQKQWERSTSKMKERKRT